MRLYLKNFMAHTETVIDLPSKGIVQVTGPNGAGKSAIIEGLAQALWGKTCRYLRWSPWREDPGHVKVRDGSLQVDRTWTGKAKRLWWVNGEEVEFDTTTKAQEALETVVGPFEVWRRTSVFSSADAAHFTMASDAERKDLLEQLLGLGWFDRALEACRRDLRAARSSLALVEKDREVAVAKSEGLAAGIKTTQEMLDQLPQHTNVGLLRSEIEGLDAHLRDVAREYQELDAKRGKLYGAGGADKERAQAARSKLSRLKDAECYACGQVVSDVVRSSLQQEIEQALADAEAAKTRVQGELDALSQALEELHEEAEGLRSVRDKKWEKLREIEHTLVTRKKLTQALKDHGEQLAKYASAIADHMLKDNSLKVDVAELEACEQLLGTRGVRAHVVGRTLGSIETLANNWLLKLGSDIRVGLKPYTEKKSGGTIDAISLTLSGAGGDQGYLGASAGERRRVDVAVLLSLAELASARSTGAAWQSPIFFDEVFDSLDANGREAVIELVEQLAQDRCVVLITHDEAIASARADLHLRIDGGSLCP